MNRNLVNQKGRGGRSVALEEVGRKLLATPDIQIATLRRMARSASRNESPRAIMSMATAWSRAEQVVLRKMACWLLVFVLEADEENCGEGVVGIAGVLANDNDWGVREEVTYVFRDLLRRDLPEDAQAYRSLMTLGSERLRRAIIVGAGRAGAKKLPNLALPLLDLLELAINDRREYVRRNLGPFAIGSYLLLYYPDKTLGRVARWSRSSDEQVRWTAAMSLSASGAVKEVEHALEILERGAEDRSLYVRNAARCALVKLGRHPSSRRATTDLLLTWSVGEHALRRDTSVAALARIGPRRG